MGLGCTIGPGLPMPTQFGLPNIARINRDLPAWGDRQRTRFRNDYQVIRSWEQKNDWTYSAIEENRRQGLHHV